jgi:predicted  nucleic acid-binding Zn-ribbon protein
MTNEELQRIQRIERNMEFIVEPQAKFETDIAEIRSAITEVKETAAKHNESIVGLLKISRTLIDSQIAAEGRMAKIEETMVELAEAEKRTDERLDSFIDFFEPYMSRRNGGEQAH